MFYWTKTNRLIKWLFSNQIWSLPNSENKIYLTFDDGPTPEVTEWVLNLLKQHNIKATFFCIGKNIQNHPDLFERVIAERHAIGNHTYTHVNGWKTTTNDYLEEIQKCDDLIQINSKSQISNSKSQIFRPPYGKISLSQSKKLQKSGYKIIMWDILTADFDTSITPKKCYENATKKSKNGSIIVFHDSTKAFKNLQYALPKAIEFYKNKGYIFDILE